MGIFSSKKETSVFVATQRMTEGKNFHTSLEYAMKDIIFSKEQKRGFYHQYIRDSLIKDQEMILKLLNLHLELMHTF